MRQGLGSRAHARCCDRPSLGRSRGVGARRVVAASFRSLWLKHLTHPPPRPSPSPLPLTPGLMMAMMGMHATRLPLSPATLLIQSHASSAPETGMPQMLTRDSQAAHHPTHPPFLPPTHPLPQPAHPTPKGVHAGAAAPARLTRCAPGAGAAPAPVCRRGAVGLCRKPAGHPSHQDGVEPHAQGTGWCVGWGGGRRRAEP